MIIVMKSGERLHATFIAQGLERWGENGPQGISFYCTDAVIWKPLSEIAEIEMDKYIIFRKV